MHIRRATSDDAELLARMNEAVQQVHYRARPDRFKPYAYVPELVELYRTRLSDDMIYAYVGEVEGEPVGYLLAQVIERGENSFTYAARALSIDEMSVSPAFRSHGYGEALMDAAVSLARSLGIRRVQLNVWAFNQRAIAFYERQGFAPRDLRMETILE